MTPSVAPAQNRHGSEAAFQNASRCLGACCGAVGKAMLEGYCNKCYVKEQSTRLNQAANRTSHSPPPVTVGLALPSPSLVSDRPWGSHPEQPVLGQPVTMCLSLRSPSF